MHLPNLEPRSSRKLSKLASCVRTLSRSIAIGRGCGSLAMSSSRCVSFGSLQAIRAGNPTVTAKLSEKAGKLVEQR